MAGLTIGQEAFLFNSQKLIDMLSDDIRNGLLKRIVSTVISRFDTHPLLAYLGDSYGGWNKDQIRFRFPAELNFSSDTIKEDMGFLLTLMIYSYLTYPFQQDLGLGATHSVMVFDKFLLQEDSVAELIVYGKPFSDFFRERCDEDILAQIEIYLDYISPGYRARVGWLGTTDIQMLLEYFHNQANRTAYFSD
ncbi:MAG: hypothetical protein KJ043_23195, partial [Anaerolineae bacterium]|nr:hypothetical protein [Anaerolineae bacterium]